jgi:hypothetical protein
MLSIRKFVGCIKVAAGLGAAALALGLSAQVATAHVADAATSDVTSISPGCLAAVQAIRAALVADHQEDADELRNPNPTGEASEDSSEASQLPPLISNLRAACAAQIAAVTTERPPTPIQPSISTQCLAAVQAFKAYVKALWAQHSPPTATQQAQLRQLGQAVRAACGMSEPSWSFPGG